ncbi:MAG TPA: glycosyltransferase 87 family protein [Solirubrobacterales bacterium]
MLVLLGLAVAGCILGAADPPERLRPTLDREALDLLRVACTTALAIVVLLGPGVLWRLLGRRLDLAYLPLVGLAVLIATAVVAWALSPSIDPRVICFAALAPLLGLLLGALVSADPADVFDREEQRALLFSGLTLGMVIGRTIWSLDPVGSLYAGAISRTLYAEPRPDSRIPYLVPELIAHGQGPFSAASASLYAPWSFSSRGPLAGLATTPIVLLTGGKPPITAPEEPWQTFDPEGFMAFRLAMMTLSLTALLAVWGAVRRIGGDRAARLVIMLAAASPFVADDLIFTWPKLLAGAFVILALLAIAERRNLRAGLLVGVGYLMHPCALFGLTGIGLLALWPARGANWRRPNLKAAIAVAVGVGVFLVGWRLICLHHYDQGEFIEYLHEAGSNVHPSVLGWLEHRLTSLGNTLVPLMLPVFHGSDFSINTLGGQSPAVIHWSDQYWSGVPFGLGIVFFPFLVLSLGRTARRRPWPFFAVLVAPLLVFCVYWGSAATGMLREGLQWWGLALLACVSLQQASAGFPWLRSKPIRTILSLRPLGALIALLLPTLGTNGFQLLSGNRSFNDAAAILLTVSCAAAMVMLSWRTQRRSEAS